MAATIELYLVRHAIAAERGPKYPDDRLRPLTPAGGKTIGWAVMDHPSNPTSSWHEPRSVHFLQPAIMAQAPVNVAKGQPLALRYRVALFDGEVPTALLNKLAAEWRR